MKLQMTKDLNEDVSVDCVIKEYSKNATYDISCVYGEIIDEVDDKFKYIPGVELTDILQINTQDVIYISMYENNNLVDILIYDTGHIRTTRLNVVWSVAKSDYPILSYNIYYTSENFGKLQKYNYKTIYTQAGKSVSDNVLKDDNFPKVRLNLSMDVNWEIYITAKNINGESKPSPINYTKINKFLK